MSGDEILVVFASVCRGRTCAIERREFDWAIDFGKGRISIAAPWRLVHDGRIAFGSDDDGHQFGLPKPVDGEALANSLLVGRRIVAVDLDQVTADLRIHFDGAARLDVFNHSAGYEGRHAHFDDETAIIVGHGGGGIMVV